MADLMVVTKDVNSKVIGMGYHDASHFSDVYGIGYTVHNMGSIAIPSDLNAAYDHAEGDVLTDYDLNGCSGHASGESCDGTLDHQ